MTSRVVAIEINKVQTFLFEAIHAHRQESQMNSGTLRAIVYSSELISKDFPEEIGLSGENGLFSGKIQETLLECSGMCVFASQLPADKIREKLKHLYEAYYIRFNGQLLVKYWQGEIDLDTDDDRLCAIRRVKKELRKKECLNGILEDNRELLFRFHKVESDRIQRDNFGSYPMFVKNINELFLKEDNSERKQDQDANTPSRFRIAVIKADLDGMGELFNNVQSYAEYMMVSKTLSQYICLDSLARCTEDHQKKQPDFKVLPLYAAGDDIYFAVPATQILEGLELCKDLCQKLNKELNSPLPLSLSIGVDFTFNREPIRYYNKRVQDQLDLAKKYKDQKCRIPIIKIALNNCVFYNFVDHNESKETPNYVKNLPFWEHFLHTVKLLRVFMRQGMQKEGWELRHWLYGLLQKISDPGICSSTVKYSNAVLYHLLPRHLDDPNSLISKLELLIIEKLLEQVTDKTSKNVHSLCFNEKHRALLKRYLQLMILFVDLRFAETSELTAQKPAQMQPWEKTVQESFKQKRIKSAVFNRTLRYLYEESLMNQLSGTIADKEALRNIFIQPASYFPEYAVHAKEIYRTLRISGSLFLRLKDVKHVGPTVASGLLEAANSRKLEEILKLETKCEQAHKAPPNLHFDRAKAKKVLMNAFQPNQGHTLWDVDYIDSLLVFYRYHEMLIRYLEIYPSAEDDKNTKSSKTE